MPRPLSALGLKGTHCVVQTDGQIGGLAQQTALGASGLAQTRVSPTSWSWTDSAAQGDGFHWPSRAGPKEVLGQARMCPKQQPELHSWDRSVCGERTLPFSPPRCACPGGWPFGAVAICLQADFLNKDYFLIGQGCGLCVSSWEGRGCRSRQGSQSGTHCPTLACGLNYPSVWARYRQLSQRGHVWVGACLGVPAAGGDMNSSQVLSRFFSCAGA